MHEYEPSGDRKITLPKIEGPSFKPVDKGGADGRVTYEFSLDKILYDSDFLQSIIDWQGKGKFRDVKKTLVMQEELEDLVLNAFTKGDAFLARIQTFPGAETPWPHEVFDFLKEKKAFPALQKTISPDFIEKTREVRGIWNVLLENFDVRQSFTVPEVMAKLSQNFSFRRQFADIRNDLEIFEILKTLSGFRSEFLEMDEKNRSFMFKSKPEGTAGKNQISSPIMNTFVKKVSNKLAPGGIDFNPANLDLQIKRDGKGVPLPVSQQPLMDMNIEGFVPIIIHIAPANIPLLLGMTETPSIKVGANGVRPNAATRGDYRSRDPLDLQKT